MSKLYEPGLSSKIHQDVHDYDCVGPSVTMVQKEFSMFEKNLWGPPVKWLVFYIVSSALD
jgi:hypothetical protein